MFLQALFIYASSGQGHGKEWVLIGLDLADPDGKIHDGP